MTGYESWYSFNSSLSTVSQGKQANSYFEEPQKQSHPQVQGAKYPAPSILKGSNLDDKVFIVLPPIAHPFSCANQVFVMTRSAMQTLKENLEIRNWLLADRKLRINLNAHEDILEPSDFLLFLGLTSENNF